MILASTVMVRKGIRDREGDAEYNVGVNIYKEAKVIQKIYEKKS